MWCKILEGWLCGGYVLIVAWINWKSSLLTQHILRHQKASSGCQVEETSSLWGGCWLCFSALSGEGSCPQRPGPALPHGRGVQPGQYQPCSACCQRDNLVHGSSTPEEFKLLVKAWRQLASEWGPLNVPLLPCRVHMEPMLVSRPWLMIKSRSRSLTIIVSSVLPYILEPCQAPSSSCTISSYPS